MSVVPILEIGIFDSAELGQLSAESSEVEKGGSRSEPKLLKKSDEKKIIRKVEGVENLTVNVMSDGLDIGILLTRERGFKRLI